MIAEKSHTRILIPVLGFARTGGYRVLSQLANKWLDAGHEVAFASPATSEAPYFPTRAEVYWLGDRGEVAECPLGKGVTGTGNQRSLFGGVRRLHPQFDIVLANHSLTSWPIMLAGVPRTKRFYYIQAYEPEYFQFEQRRLLWLASRLSYELPFSQIVNSTYYRRLEDRPFVPFGIDLNIFRPVEAALPSRDALTIGTIGRSEIGKGTRFVLEAFQMLRSELPGVRLKVAFGNLPEGIDLSGIEVVVPRNDVELASFYQSVDILIAGTYGQNGAPHYPVLEAMACGIPIVNTGYLPATNENSWLARPRDASSLADQVLRIVSDPVATASKRALALEAVKPFSWDAVAARMMELFWRLA